MITHILRPFNRTILESKLHTAEELIERFSELLIEPFWNRNSTRRAIFRQSYRF